MRSFPARVRAVVLHFVSLALLGTPAIGGPAGTAWPHEGSDVPSDPAIRWGRLENGLRYAARKNTKPAGRVHMALQVAVGPVH